MGTCSSWRHGSHSLRKIGDNMADIEIKDFSKWDFKNEIDLMIVDPPFGIDFDKKKGNYNRDKTFVVDGYVEWDLESYYYNIWQLIDSADRYLNENGSLLLFSSWLSSVYISNVLSEENFNLRLQGKLYWIYNFAPYCIKRPAHNVQEIFWLTKSDNYFYNNECSMPHCLDGESNLSTIKVNREFIKGMVKYKTRQPSILCGTIIEHFSTKGFKILDPCCGSGMYGIIVRNYYNDRDIYLGDLNKNTRRVYKSLESRLPFFEINKHIYGDFGLMKFIGEKHHG